MRTIHWQLTFSCNLRCRYCWNETRALADQRLSLSRAQAALAEIAALGQDQVLLTGGEPFLCEELELLVEQGVRAGVPMTVFSNGTLLSEERIHQLIKIGRAGRLM